MAGMTNGWAWPGNAKKAHYFIDGRAACGRWLFAGEPDPGQKCGDAPRRDDCKACWRAAKAAEKT